MRLISQSKEADIPYENACLFFMDERNPSHAFKDDVMTAIKAVVGESYFTMGLYLTKDDAKQVLEDCRAAYKKNATAFQFR